MGILLVGDSDLVGGQSPRRYTCHVVALNELACCPSQQWHEANLYARNAIPLCSYCMASLQKSKLLSALVNKGRRVIGKKSTHVAQSPSLPGETESATNNSPSTTSQKIFKKSNDARRDMRVLAMTYILQDCTTIRELILLIISLNDHDNSGKVCTTCNPWM